MNESTNENNNKGIIIIYANILGMHFFIYSVCVSKMD